MQTGLNRRAHKRGITQIPLQSGVQFTQPQLKIAVLHIGPTGTIWGRGNDAADTYSPFRLFRSKDGGRTWVNTYTHFPFNPYDKIQAIYQTSTGAVLIMCANNVDAANQTNGRIYRSTNDGVTFSAYVHEFIKGGCVQSWNLDGNANYIVAGTYGYTGATACDRDAWVSTDDGVTWARCFHIENSTGYHIHISRVDPDGGCWVSVGDTGAHLGLWHAPAGSLTGGPSNNAPVAVADGADAFGDFTKIYYGGQIRPTSALFSAGPSGQKYAYMGEDSQTIFGSSVRRTIVRIRYDAVSFTAEDWDNDNLTCASHGLLTGDHLPLYGSDLPAPLATSTVYWAIRMSDNTFRLAASYADAMAGTPITLTDGGSGAMSFNYHAQVKSTHSDPAAHRAFISLMCKVTDTCWIAALPVEGGSTPAMLISHDAGETWNIDTLQPNGMSFGPLVSLRGMVFGAQSPATDTAGWMYRPVAKKQLEG